MFWWLWEGTKADIQSITGETNVAFAISAPLTPTAILSSAATVTIVGSGTADSIAYIDGASQLSLSGTGSVIAVRLLTGSTTITVTPTGTLTGRIGRVLTFTLAHTAKFTVASVGRA